MLLSVVFAVRTDVVIVVVFVLLVSNLFKYFLWFSVVVVVEL